MQKIKIVKNTHQIIFDDNELKRIADFFEELTGITDIHELRIYHDNHNFRCDIETIEKIKR